MEAKQASFQVPPLRVLSLAFLVMLGVTTIVGCTGGGGGGVTPDTVAPVTSASPAGGTYGSVQSVTLDSNEPATIYYSVDGNDPSIGGANTHSGSSPVSGISIGGGTTFLKYFAVDSSNNQEVTKSQTYIVDLLAPNVTLSSSAPSPIGLLATANVSWQSDEAGTYSVELGGNGSLGSGTPLSSGSLLPGTPITSQIPGIDLSYAASTSVWIYVTDSVGHTGSVKVDLYLKATQKITVGSELWDMAIAPDGLKAYVTNTSANSVIVIDTDPSSGTFNTILGTVTVGTRPIGIAFTPDGVRAYVTNNGNTSIDVDSISEIATATDTVTATILLGGNSAPTGIAITPDGTRAYFLAFDEQIHILDTDPASGTYNTVNGSINRTLLLAGELGITPDGTMAVVNWQGTIAHAIDLFDVNPASGNYNQLLASPVPVVSGLSGGIAISADSAYAYVSDNYFSACGVCKVNLQTHSIVAKNSTAYSALQNALALTPNGSFVLTGSDNSTVLSLFNAADITFMGNVELGIYIHAIAISPDGTRAYILGGSVQGGSRDIVEVPLQ